MAKYRVIKEFLDLTDQNFRYAVGNDYPRSGHAPTKERIHFLLSDQNLLHTPVIEAVTDPHAAEQGTVEAEGASEWTENALNAPEEPEVIKYTPKRKATRKTANKARSGKGK